MHTLHRTISLRKLGNYRWLVHNKVWPQLLRRLHFSNNVGIIVIFSVKGAIGVYISSSLSENIRKYSLSHRTNGIPYNIATHRFNLSHSLHYCHGFPCSLWGQWRAFKQTVKCAEEITQESLHSLSAKWRNSAVHGLDPGFYTDCFLVLQLVFASLTPLLDTFKRENCCQLYLSDHFSFTTLSLSLLCAKRTVFYEDSTFSSKWCLLTWWNLLWMERTIDCRIINCCWVLIASIPELRRIFRRQNIETSCWVGGTWERIWLIVPQLLA